MNAGKCILRILQIETGEYNLGHRDRGYSRRG
jgi:hypothetical protein